MSELGHEETRRPRDPRDRSSSVTGPRRGGRSGALSKLHAADDERRQAKRNSLADRLTAEANALADLKIEKAAVEGERRVVEADLGPVRYPATLMRLRRSGCAPVFHPGGGTAA